MIREVEGPRFNRPEARVPIDPAELTCRRKRCSLCRLLSRQVPLLIRGSDSKSRPMCSGALICMLLLLLLLTLCWSGHLLLRLLKPSIPSQAVHLRCS